jgi:pimeloyl-ACP methyl ester carboxylesterase
LAERKAAFQIRDVSPVAAAADIRVPVLLIHGASDHHTPLEHSRRVFEALPGPKRLFVVPNAGHNQSLSGPVWSEIDEWLDAVIPLVKPG